MRALALVTLLALTADARTGRFERTNSRTPQGRSERGFLGDSLAFLEFAPASGAGMGAACACTTPTGAKGEALTFTRASSATCTKTATGGLATSGIANGDLVTCSTNQPRVEYDSAGVLGLLVESARTNVLLRSDALTNAAWADVGTPNATDGATDPFGTTTGDTLTDNAAGAFEGRSQAVTVSAATAYVMSCYLKGTTSAKARLSLDGTTCDTSTLSSTTWSLVTCADASSSGVSISAQVLVGNAVGDTGDVVVGGCQVEAGTYATSYMPTGVASAARLAELADLPMSPSLPTGFSVAATVTAPAAASNARLHGTPGNGALGGAGSASYCDSYYGVSFVAETSSAAPVSNTYVTAWASGDRWATYLGNAKLAGCKNGTCDTEDAVTYTPPTWTRYRIGAYDSSNGIINGIASRICFDPSPTRCR